MPMAVQTKARHRAQLVLSIDTVQQLLGPVHGGGKVPLLLDTHRRVVLTKGACQLGQCDADLMQLIATTYARARAAAGFEQMHQLAAPYHSTLPANYGARFRA